MTFISPRLSVAMLSPLLVSASLLSATPVQAAPTTEQTLTSSTVTPASNTKARAAEAQSLCTRVVTGTPGHWTEDSGCSWSTPPVQGPSVVGFEWSIAASGSNQTACVEARTTPRSPWKSAGCGKQGTTRLAAPGYSIGAYQVRVMSTQPFSIASVRWGDGLRAS